jgi:hypothetical protein
MSDTSPGTGPTPAPEIGPERSLLNAASPASLAADDDQAQSSIRAQDLFPAVLSFHAVARLRAAQEEQAGADAIEAEALDDGHSPALPVSSVIAAAGAVVAAEEARRMQEYVDAACIAAAVAFARSPSAQGPSLAQRERSAWVANERVITFAAEHNRLARRSVLAATLAAEALANTMSADDLPTSTLMDDSLLAILDAKAVVRESDAITLAAREHQYAASAAVSPDSGGDKTSAIDRVFAIEVNAAQVLLVAADVAAAGAWAHEPLDPARIFACERQAKRAREHATELVAVYGRRALP